MKKKITWRIIIIGLIIVNILAYYILKPVKPCTTDLNYDHKTDSLDLKIVEKYYGLKPESPENEAYSADINKDGKVSSDDLAILIGAYGTKCNKLWKLLP